MTWRSARPWLATAIRVVLGVVFVWASLSKLSDPRGFVQTVRAYDATPEWLSKTIGYGLPVLELAVGVLLLLGVITRTVAAVAAVLLFLFAIGLIQAAARDIKLECGCFGGGGASTSTSYLLDILRDLVLLALAVFLVLWPSTYFSVDERLARSDYVEPPSAKRMRTPEGARKYRSQVEARRRVARSRTRYLNTAIVALVLLVGVISIGVQSGRAKISADTSSLNATATGGVQLGVATAKVKIDLYEDFQCPACKALHDTTGSEIDKMISNGYAQVRVHMMAFLDRASSGNRYSSRAANASICAADINTETFLKYYDLLYGKDKAGAQVQPAEGAGGRPDADFIRYAREIGITDETQIATFTTCVQTEQHKSLVLAVTDDASKKGITVTPTVFVQGKKLETPDRAAFDAAVVAAAGGTPIPTAVPSPSASASGSASVPTSGSPSGAPSVSPSVPVSPSASPSG